LIIILLQNQLITIDKAYEYLILAFQDMCEKYGYSRSYGGFKRAVAKLKADKPKRA